MRNQNSEYEVVRTRKYGAFTVLKIIIFCWLVAFIMNTGSYGLVGFNHFASKALGLASDAVAYCANCLEALASR